MYECVCSCGATFTAPSTKMAYDEWVRHKQDVMLPECHDLVSAGKVVQDRLSVR